MVITTNQHCCCCNCCCCHLRRGTVRPYPTGDETHRAELRPWQGLLGGLGWLRWEAQPLVGWGWWIGLESGVLLD